VSQRHTFSPLRSSHVPNPEHPASQSDIWLSQFVPKKGGGQEHVKKIGRHSPPFKQAGQALSHTSGFDNVSTTDKPDATGAAQAGETAITPGGILQLFLCPIQLVDLYAYTSRAKKKFSTSVALGT
jgi:hypothetical protein